jgi:membrane protein implicated in regulation of membrane protease activity
MIEAVVLFLVGTGALLVSIASILRMAWLAVVAPLLIAGVAAYWVLALGRRRPRRPRRLVDQGTHAHRTDDRMAA